jgi:hypothetical protein
MSDKNPEYKIIKNAISKEYAQFMLDKVYEHNLTEPHDFDGFLGIKLDYSIIDPENKVSELIKYAEEYFNEKYLTENRSILLTRSYGTIMHPGSMITSHKDLYNSGRLHDFSYGDALVFNLYISDCEGGELYFEDLGVELKVNAGDVVLFPGYLLNHGVRTVTSGLRVAFLNHFSFLSEEDTKDGNINAKKINRYL